MNIQMMEKVVKDIITIRSLSIPNLSSCILKDAFRVIFPHLVFMYNLSFTTGHGLFPDAWKVANVVPPK